jgi:hypothetical protein
MEKDRMRMILPALLAVLLASSPAFAQTDVTPVVMQFIDVIAITLMGGSGVLVAFVIRWIASKTRLADNEFEALLANRLNDILHRAIEYAVVVAKNEVNKPGSGLTAVKFDNFFMNIAVNLAMKSMPDIIKQFNLTKERIEEMIISRLDGYLGEVSAEGGASAIEKVVANATPARA